MAPDRTPDDYAEAPETMPPSFAPAQDSAAEAAPAPRDADTDTINAIGAEKADRKRTGWSMVLEFFTVIAVALLCSVIIKTFFVQAFEIPSESMESTLVPGDRILVNKLADDVDEINRGDVVVFVDPGGWLDVQVKPATGLKKLLLDAGQMVGLVPQNIGEHLVKRVIGVEGDVVESAGNGEPVLVNGVPLGETYLKAGVQPSVEAFKVTVPEGHLWVMGDNRPNSKDSRYHQRVSGFGFVPIENVEGRAWMRIYPFSRIGSLDDVSQVFSKVPEPAAAS